MVKFDVERVRLIQGQRYDVPAEDIPLSHGRAEIGEKALGGRPLSPHDFDLELRIRVKLLSGRIQQDRQPLVPVAHQIQAGQNAGENPAFFQSNVDILNRSLLGA